MSADFQNFSLVLSGGGARGFAHMGALKALEEEGLRPSMIVGVSMGSLVGAVYALHEDWYNVLRSSNLAKTLADDQLNFDGWTNLYSLLRFLRHLPRAIWGFFFGWGLTPIRQKQALQVIEQLTRGKKLEDARIPIAISATDLLSGNRVVIRTGNAARAIYASAALAGVFPPLKEKDSLLADGAYTDLAPIDVARITNARVIAIDASQSMALPEIRNAFQALMRAVDICHMQHARLRFLEADLLLRPSFTRFIDTLDFSLVKECVDAGYSMIKGNLPSIRSLLGASTTG
ncbi:MAG TPA: hypothetical protein DEA96_05075 [Leptospiraceae bacterium]|nr:hypothetical protein [Spirochaetaceae bacterium]HBS04317.1 hypothetical protein [Leptospiraceae bacterium]|tara:strand:+ start:2572 stop:3438 length:867 start_codon:yes stop_codon:yes gene_type:complete